MGPNKRSEIGDKPEMRKANGQFAKGNKTGGRKKKPAAIKEMANIALPRLWEIAEDKHTKDKDRADIYKWIYEQAYGKATQRIAGETDGAPVIAISMIPPDVTDYVG